MIIDRCRSFIPTDLNLTISRQTVSRILHNFDMVSYIAPKEARITPAQRRTLFDYCYEHLSWSMNHWSKDESNYEILEPNIYIYTRRFRLDFNVHNNVYIEEEDY